MDSLGSFAIPKKEVCLDEESNVQHLEVQVSRSSESVVSSTIERKVERRLLWKLDLFLLPIVSITYLLAYLDRGNIGNARLSSLEADLGLVGNDFYNALSMFYIGYVLWQIPSNLALKAVPPGKWVGFVMIVWGVCSTCVSATHNASGLMAVRFFLGCSEAGIGTSIPLLLSFWYQRHEQAARYSIYFGASTIAGAFGGALGWAVIGHMDGIHGLASWRWLFIIEGIPTIFMGIISFFVLPNYPETASRHFLTDAEREVAVKRMKAGPHGQEDQSISKHQIIAAFKDYKNWLTSIIFCGTATDIASFSLFLPTIVKGMGFESLQVQLLTIPPYVVGCVVLFIVSWYSDKTRQRGIPMICCSTVAIIGYVCLIIGNSVALQYVGAVLVACGVFPLVALGLSWVTNNQVGHTKRGVGLGMSNMIGQTVSIAGTQIYRNEDAPNYRKGHIVSLALITLTLVTSAILRTLLVRENNRRDKVYGKPEEIDVDKIEGGIELYDNHPAFRYIP